MFGRRRAACTVLVWGALLGLAACSYAAREAPAADGLHESSAALTRAEAQAQVASLERQLIRTVTLELAVESAASARHQAEVLLAQAGGYIEALDSSRYGGNQRVSLTLRVPKDKLDGLLVPLRKLGTLQHETQGVEDVTRKVVDADARLRNLQQTEQRLLTLLGSAQGGLNEVLAVERELSRVREENEVLTSELRALKEQVGLSTIKLGLNQESDPEPPPSMWSPWRRLGRNAGNILETSLGGLLAFGAALLEAFLYLLPWSPLLLLGGWGVRRWWQRRRLRKQASNAP